MEINETAHKDRENRGIEYVYLDTKEWIYMR